MSRMRISDRHEDTLGGRFLPFGDGKPVGITIEVDRASAALPATQHGAWMLINLLCRFQGIVARIGVRCPQDVRLAGRVVPLAPADVDLATALIQGANAIGIVAVEPDLELDRVVAVGAGVEGEADLYVCGNGWAGGISAQRAEIREAAMASSLPFGPYVGACLAAAEIYKAVRIRAHEYEPVSAAFYSLWTHEPGERLNEAGPQLVSREVRAVLAGVGAVGTAFLHTIWACPDLTGSITMADDDEKGVDATNLNRYTLFGRADVEARKATAAAKLLEAMPLHLEPNDKSVESLNLSASRVVSAVDRNTSREAIQNLYPPRIFSASTLDLRAEVLRCGPPGVGACLRCFNPPEKLPSDEELCEELRLLSDNDLAAVATSYDVTLTEAKDWIKKPGCGKPGERLLQHLKAGNDSRTFAVGFVSMMAGVMVAAELIKDILRSEMPLSEVKQRAVFQFFRLLAGSNGASEYMRQRDCPMCDPSTVACQTWAKRYNTL